MGDCDHHVARDTLCRWGDLRAEEVDVRLQAGLSVDCVRSSGMVSSVHSFTLSDHLLRCGLPPQCLAWWFCRGCRVVWRGRTISIYVVWLWWGVAPGVRRWCLQWPWRIRWSYGPCRRCEAISSSTSFQTLGCASPSPPTGSMFRIHTVGWTVPVPCKACI